MSRREGEDDDVSGLSNPVTPDRTGVSTRDKGKGTRGGD